MIVKYIKDEYLRTIKRNTPIVFKYMKNSDSNAWLYDYFKDDCFGISKIKAPDFKLDTSYEKPIDGDFKNAKIIYETFKGLNETQAIDERLWGGLAFGECYDYMLYRWPLKSDKNINYRWVFYTTNRRKLFFHSLSRLWWFAKMTYDEKYEDPYELTEFVFMFPRIILHMSYRNFSNSDKIRKSILYALKKYDSEGGLVNTKIIDELYKYVSLLGSVSILDAYDYDEIFIKMYDYLIKRIN